MVKDKEGKRKAVLPKEINDFIRQREQLNNVVMKYKSVEIKRFFSLDNQVYNEGALSVKIKELIGLVSSLVMRCNDCILYHIIRCYEEGLTDEELIEGLSIGLVVGGSVVIPHLRFAIERWDKLKKK